MISQFKKYKALLYESPRVEIIEIRVEQGFAGSIIGGSTVEDEMDNAGGGNFDW